MGTRRRNYSQLPVSSKSRQRPSTSRGPGLGSEAPRVSRAASGQSCAAEPASAPCASSLCPRPPGARAPGSPLRHHEEQGGERDGGAVAQPSGHPHLRVVVWEQHGGGSPGSLPRGVRGCSAPLAEAETEGDGVRDSGVRGPRPGPAGPQCSDIPSSLRSVPLSLWFSACVCFSPTASPLLLASACLCVTVLV